MKIYSRNKQGIAAVYLALFISVTIGLAAYVIDLGIGYTAQTRIKNAVDLSTLAGISKLINTSDITDAKTEAIAFLNSNLSLSLPGYTNVSLGDTDLTVEGGNYDFSTNNFTFDESSVDINALKVEFTYTTMTFLGSIFMTDDITVRGSSLAAKQPAGYLAPGSGFPFVLYNSALDTALGNNFMVDLFSGGTMDNSYWTDFTQSNPSTNDVRDLIDYLQYGTGDAPPAITVNDTFDINDGGMGALFMDLDPSVVVGMTFLFTVIDDGAMNSAMAQGFVAATIDLVVDNMSDNYLSITIIPSYIDNNFGGTTVSMGVLVSSSGASLLADSFTLVH